MTDMKFAEQVRAAKLRLLKMHYESRVGHLGGNLSCFDSMMVLFHKIMSPDDIFVLSKGHAAGALYICLWSMGIIEEKELSSFHKNDSRLAGHPIGGVFPEIKFSTGSLGHGFGLASGIALAKRHKKERGKIFCLCSDGEWQEGSTWEALFFSTHTKLTNLTVLVDINGLQGFGRVEDISGVWPVAEKLSAIEAEVISVEGHNLTELCEVLSAPQNKLRIVLMNTIKGSGISFMEHEMAWHYLPLNDSQYEQAVREIGIS